MTAPHLAERQLFTSRYGLNDRADLDVGDWQQRHKIARTDANSSPISSCRCPGPSLATSPCGLKVTQEDGLCDECRQWCVCVDRAGNLHLLADQAARNA